MSDKCIVISSDDEIEMKKESNGSWTGKLARKKPREQKIYDFFQKKENGSSTATNGGEKSAMNNSLVDTPPEACNSKISEVIKECEKHLLKPEDSRIKQKLAKLHEIDKRLHSDFSAFLTKLGPITPRNVFSQIKTILSEAKRLKDIELPKDLKIASETPGFDQTTSSGASTTPSGDILETKLTKLEKLLQRLSLKIKELQLREVDFSDEETSAYVLEDKLVQRFNKVYKTYRRYLGKSATEKVKIKFEGSRYPQVNLSMQQFLRKHKVVPDYADVLKVVKSTNEKDSLRLDDALVTITARECFEKAVHLMRQVRVNDMRDSVFGFAQDEAVKEDPAEAEGNIELKSKLLENSRVGQAKMNEVFEKFVTKQEYLKLEGEEYNSDDLEAEGEEEEEVPQEQDVVLCDQGESIEEVSNPDVLAVQVLIEEVEDCTEIEDNSPEVSEVDISEAVDPEAKKPQLSDGREDSNSDPKAEKRQLSEGEDVPCSVDPKAEKRHLSGGEKDEICPLPNKNPRLESET